MKNRQPGFYWVFRALYRGWEVAEWTGFAWLEAGNKHSFHDGEYFEIDERRIERQET